MTKSYVNKSTGFGLIEIIIAVAVIALLGGRRFILAGVKKADIA